MSQGLIDLITDLNEQAVILFGFDDAIIGIAEAKGKFPQVVYAKEVVLDIIQSDGISREEANEYFQRIIVDQNSGEEGPLFLTFQYDL